MPDLTPRLGIKKPLGNENVTRASFNENWDIIDANATTFSDVIRYAVTTNSANAYSATLTPAPTAYADGMGVAVKINADNIGSASLNLNGLGAKPLKKANGNDVAILKANGVYTFRYNATTGNFILQGEGANGNAIASDLLSGKTASTDAGDITGTMPNNGSVTIVPGNISKPIPLGYHYGGTVQGDIDLTPSNILSGVSIFGVVGALVPGKKFASGTVSGTTNNPHTYTYLDGTTMTGQNSLIVTGLTFKPSFIYCNCLNGSQTDIVVYSERVGEAYAKTIKAVSYFTNAFNGAAGVRQFKGDVSNASVTSTGFTLFTPNQSGLTFQWVAFE